MSETGEISETPISFTGSENNQLAATRFAPVSQSIYPPTLLMHGGGQTRHSWNNTARLLARNGYLAYTVDARGHGDSEWLENKHYQFEHFSADLHELARLVGNEHGNKPPILIGASMGGISAMLAQVEGGFYEGESLFSAIILVDIAPQMTNAGVDKIMGFMSKNLSNGFASVEEAADVIASYLPDRPRPKTLDGLRKNLRRRGDGRWYWHWDPAFVSGPHSITTARGERVEELVEAVKKIDVSTLLIRGTKSELITMEAVEEFLTMVPHAKFVDVNDAGHMVAGDKNDVFASTVIEFLDSELSD